MNLQRLQLFPGNQAITYVIQQIWGNIERPWPIYGRPLRNHTNWHRGAVSQDHHGTVS